MCASGVTADPFHVKDRNLGEEIAKIDVRENQEKLPFRPRELWCEAQK